MADSKIAAPCCWVCGFRWLCSVRSFAMNLMLVARPGQG